ncbi:hypothetical protein H2200_008666 [Cladophialophora chaetospira]|uniref:Trichothecene 3-O-acetyltransferase-like N-terminal domain-containing protein n=1 Tax=Cladophialophora chaetospira TaxID=386627 RepID=A0AA38X4R6_9EURO|nr:hypothetical protein H2200_008666 [Cladophialophora chaetospira]
MEDLGVQLDILGRGTGLFKLYTQLCLCFDNSNGPSQSETVDILTNGLELLAASFPWVAGQVVNTEPDGKAESYRIVPHEKIPRLVIKDLRDSLSMDTLRQANFPSSMLDESVVAPINTLAAGTEGPAPVFAVQANLVKGGLLLTFVTQHNTMDMTGMAQVMNLLSLACRGDPFTVEELRIGNLDRHNLIPLLDEDYTPGPELDRQIAKIPTHATVENALGEGPDTSSPPHCSWTYFVFSGIALAVLKSIATISLASKTQYVSTDDVLSAFIWQAVTKARLSRLNPAEETTFARATDPRRYLDIPASYPGLVQNMTYATYNLGQIVKEPLGAIASELRTGVDPKTSNLGYATRALTTWFHRAEDKSNINVTATLDLSKDIMLSSWAKYDCYDLEFNLGLGKPEAVRRPQFTPVESLFYLMPKRPDGEIAAALCLRDEDLERLKGDAEFMRYAVYVG